MTEHKEPDGRRQIAVTPFGIDRGDKIGQRRMPNDRDLPQAFPERIFKADAGLVAGHNDRALDDC